MPPARAGRWYIVIRETGEPVVATHGAELDGVVAEPGTQQAVGRVEAEVDGAAAAQCVGNDNLCRAAAIEIRHGVERERSGCDLTAVLADRKSTRLNSSH